jgi:hypothetical protein
MWFLSGTGRGDNIDQQQTAQQAFAQIQSDLNAVIGNGKDLMSSDPVTAFKYYQDAWNELKIAEKNNYPAALLADPRSKVLAGLNRYYHVSIVQPQIVVTFATDNLKGVVLGPDGAAYVLDDTVNAVYRVNLDTGAKIRVVTVGQQPINGGAIVGNPEFLTTGGGDVLVLDAYNSVWRWHPVQGNTTGVGSLIPVYIPDNVNWGIGARAIGTFVINAAQNLYNFYIVVPSQKQVIKYTAAPDGSGYPKQTRSNFLLVAQDLTTVDDMYIDGKIYLVQAGKITQYELGQAKGWSVDSPPDSIGAAAIRPAPVYQHMTSDDPAQDKGDFYGYDIKNRRIVEFLKSDGSVIAQYMVPDTTPWFTSLTGMFVAPATTGSPPMLYWTEGSSLVKAALTATGTVTPGGPAGATNRPSPSSSAGPGSIGPSSTASAKP